MNDFLHLETNRITVVTAGSFSHVIPIYRLKLSGHSRYGFILVLLETIESSEDPEDNRNLDFASTQSTRVAVSADTAESVPFSLRHLTTTTNRPLGNTRSTLLDNVPINIGVAENPIDIDDPSTIFPSPSNIISYENDLVTGLDTEPLIVPPPAPIPRSQVPCNSRSSSIGIPITDSWTTAPWGSLENDIRILPTLLNRLQSNTTPGDSLEYPIELGETGDSIVDPINVDEEEGPSVPVFTSPTTTTTHTITNQRGEIFTITNNLITAITAPNFPVNVTAVHVNVNQYTDDLVITLQSPPGTDNLDYVGSFVSSITFHSTEHLLLAILFLEHLVHLTRTTNQFHRPPLTDLQSHLHQLSGTTLNTLQTDLLLHLHLVQSKPLLLHYLPVLLVAQAFD
ncbi:hypothetical protein BDP27DRAFT_1408335 [Rhodocollybia butyracea]|uniref:Uncharacterized protein n=1 Tax=Rhodocollybia butyracea TaxID=206335 RepID=A0A9P5P535_9AGAR|nr:hypothetical protein BDP27DRAFT_1408335 [Rhodocollybia butyracea]